MARKTGKNLVIVESPAKAKTINKYLGDGFIVKASMGHVRDLPSKGMGVDLKTFEPSYEILESRGKVIGELKKLARESEMVYLATDLDREGEAIAWHLKEALGIPDSRVVRVIFNAITKAEIQKAFQNPHQIDLDRVNAQQARRILDRIVGYEISPLLWRKVAKGLSAGRVQSVAVRLVVEREREIEAFVPDEFWKIGAIFTADGKKHIDLARQWSAFMASGGNGKGASHDAGANGAAANGNGAAVSGNGGNGNSTEPTKAEQDRWLTEHGAFAAELVEWAGKKFEPSDAAVALAAAKALGYLVKEQKTIVDEDAKGPARNRMKTIGTVSGGPAYVVESVEKKRTTSKPSAPFITSTLQQRAASRLGFGAQKTMRTAQSLYEAGHITYMRTDSTNLSAEALTMARTVIGREFGSAYLPEKANVYASSNKNAQEAHEAIRPTDVDFQPDAARGKLGPDESRLYQLIWAQFTACQMTPAQFDQTTVNIGATTSNGKALFRASGRKLVFDGFMRVAGVSSGDQLLPELAQKSSVYPIDLSPTQHFTQPPPRFTEASLVKELERLGIGRPSTYASIIQTIQDRQYVEQMDRRFHATMLGSIVTDKLVQAFPEIMNVQFTAGMELKLDAIEEQHLDWVKLLKDFYGPFHEVVDGALDKIEHAGGTPSPYKCDKCGQPMVYRIGKNGFFLSCTRYPECDGIRPVDQQGKPKMQEKSPYKCPKCGREMIKRKGRFGEFLGCSGYGQKDAAGKPLCETILNLDKEGRPMPPKTKVMTPIKCEKCGSAMILRDSKRGPFLGCSAFPKCRATKQVKKLEGEELKLVEAPLPALNEGNEKAREMAAVVSSAAGLSMPAPAKAGPVATDIDCDECGKPMIIREGRRGKFLGCSGYPKCKNTAEVPAKLMDELAATAGAVATPANGKPVAVASEELIDADLSIE